MKTPTLETDRLILRPISLDDAPALEKHFNNWDIVKYTMAPWPYPENGVQEHFKELMPRIASGEQITWVIVLKGESEAIGRIDYRFFKKPPDRGFWLAKEYHGQGIMSETVEATQDYIFFNLKVDRIVVENLKENIGSGRIKEKTGAKLLKEEPDMYSPHIPDAIRQFWELTREDWAKIRGKQI